MSDEMDDAALEASLNAIWEGGTLETCAGCGKTAVEAVWDYADLGGGRYTRTCECGHVQKLRVTGFNQQGDNP